MYPDLAHIDSPQTGFDDMMKNTVGADLTTKRFLLDDGKVVAIHLWDTGMLSGAAEPHLDQAGQERFHAVTRNYFRGADAAIYVYDITSGDSLDAVKVCFSS